MSRTFIFLSSRRPPRPTLFPSTTLFRSTARGAGYRSPIDLLARSGLGRAVLTRLAEADAFRSLGEPRQDGAAKARRSEEHTSELQSQFHLVCRPLPEKKKTMKFSATFTA